MVPVVLRVTVCSIDSAGKWIKNGESEGLDPNEGVYGGKVKNASHLRLIGVLVLAGAGLGLTGCKSAPELTAADAQKMIQAKYDAKPAVPYNIVVDDQGMVEGVVAKYWLGVKKYPNGYWADLKLTPEGAKLVKLSSGDTIQWHPDKPKDPVYSITVTTVAPYKLKGHDVTDIQDEVLPDASNAKGASFTESVVLDGMPDALQGIAHNPGNKLSVKRHADFVFADGAWTLKSIQ